MDARITIILVYLLATLVIGSIFRRTSKLNKTEFFLAGRSLTRVLLFFTMSATNFSAFTIFGLSGAGYRIGYGFYPLMGFGTGFMALTFHIIGHKIFILSKNNYITPSDFIYDRYRSAFLKKLFSLVMVVFTLPYIAIQAIASGKSLNALAGIPYLAGALLVTGFVVAYVALGGMRSIAWTDLFQGILMIGFTFTAFIIIARRLGGFVPVHREILKIQPALMSRPGGNAVLGPGVWFGYLFLWFFADPMFPQLFQRFMAARDERALQATAVLYPLVTTFLFFLTVSIGVMGRIAFPDLSPELSDTIFPLLLGRFTGTFLSTLLLTGSIAALMSTMDSQLLTLTSMITNDFFAIKRNEILKEKIVIILLGVIGFIIAIRPPQTILDFINKTTFNGLSVLAPSVIGGLYWKKANRFGAVTSILAGETLVVLFYLNILATPSVLPVVPIVSVSGVLFITVSLLTASPGENTDIVFSIRPSSLLWAAFFVFMFLLGNDFWNWSKKPVLLAGLPLWVWYFIGLGIVLSAAMMLYFKRSVNTEGRN